MRSLLSRLLTGLLCFALALPGWAQTAAAAGAETTYTKEQFDQLLAPIALYPDSLLSQVLMASTYPADVGLAVKWSAAHPNDKGDAAVKMVANEPWEASVQSLVAFPQVLATMGQKPTWVQDLGDAFLAQPSDVMDSVQRLRKLAQDAGQLKSNEQQKVTVETPVPSQPPVIIIQPAQPQVVYVPTYNPTVVYGPWPYPAYPPIYIPPPPGYAFGNALLRGIAFGTGLAISNALWGGCNWGGGWGHSSVNINVNRYNNINVNNKLNVNQTNFNHNAAGRKGVPYGNNRVNQQYGKNVPGSNARNDFRGREARPNDARREAAANTFAGRTNDPATRQRMQQEAGNLGGRAGAAGGAATRPAPARNNNALSGVSSGGAAANRDFNRGNASRQAASRPSPQRAAPAPQRAAPASRPAPRAGGGGQRGGGHQRGR